jgi:hypothetical protein
MRAGEKILFQELMSGAGQPKLQGSKLEEVLERFEGIANASVKNDIDKLKDANNMDILALGVNCMYDYIHDSNFPGQGGPETQCYLFKMSTHGRGSGVDIVRRMFTEGSDLQNSWIVFDHVKRVEGWTTLACQSCV